MQSGRVRGFLPTRSGLHFVNAWPKGTNYPVVTLPVLGTVISGDATHGLCGGFVSTALDCFLHSPRLLPPATTTKPPAGSPLFNYLVQRLIDSFLAPCPDGFINDAAKCIAWIQTPGHDVKVSVYGAGLARRMVQTEWPKIQADIDSGKPSPLYLVAAPQCGTVLNLPCITTALSSCHQVLAYAYTLDDANNLTLWVYDCNDPFNNSSTIELNISDPSHTINITAAAIVAALTGGVVIRGIFHQDYSFNDPTAIMSLLAPDRSFALTELPVLLLTNNPSLVPETHLLL